MSAGVGDGRGALALAVGALCLMLLSACSPPTRFGVRLNVDDTVDFVLCDSTPDSVEVDYSPYDGADWAAELSNDAAPPRVVRYGDPSYVASILEPPPADWNLVSLNGITVGRDDLVAGEWVWFTEDLPFVPDRPCATVSNDELVKP